MRSNPICHFALITILTSLASANAAENAETVMRRSLLPDDSGVENLDLLLHTGNPITVAEKGREDQFYFKVVNRQQAAAVRFRLDLDMVDYDGRQFHWNSEVLSVGPDESVKIPLADVIPALGWWRIRPTIRAADADVAAVKPTRELAYIDPIGPSDLPPDDGFWFGLDSRVRSPAMLRLFAQMGVNIIRYGTWAGVNPGQDEFTWEPFDEVVDAIRANGMQALYSITFTPAYAVKPEYRGKGDPSRLPPRPEALREALQKIIAHTEEKGLTIYDLWNEPDHRGFWRGKTDDYLEFMRVAYQTIKTVQPDATVLSGGIASLHPGRFDDLNPDMDRRILLEGQNWYDAIALHEHGTFDRFAEALDGPLAQYRKQLAEHKPLWLTETGYNGDAHDKAAVLVQKYAYARAHDAEGLVWYAFYPPGQGGEYNIIDAQGDPQPIIPAYNQMVRMIRGKRFVRIFQDSTQTGNRLFAFANRDQTLLVAWGEGATAYRAPIVLDDSAEAELFDIMGRQLQVERAGNTVFLPFARTPRYLQVSGEVEVRNYEQINPLSLFEFGSHEPSAGAQSVRVSPLEMIGWKRENLDDQDARMNASTSGHPNGLFDGDDAALQLRFTVTPANGASIHFETLGFWGNAGASSDTMLTVTYQVAGAESFEVGSTQLGNLSTPRTRGEYYSFPLTGLEGIRQPVTFTLTARRSGQRVILKIDDLRVDGLMEGVGSRFRVSRFPYG
jgi:hypothetical protein